MAHGALCLESLGPSGQEHTAHSSDAWLQCAVLGPTGGWQLADEELVHPVQQLELELLVRRMSVF